MNRCQENLAGPKRVETDGDQLRVRRSPSTSDTVIFTGRRFSSGEIGPMGLSLPENDAPSPGEILDGTAGTPPEVDRTSHLLNNDA